MGHYRGPNTSTDGLVFGYDTGVGLVDNVNGYRYYKGAPLTNYASNGTARSGGVQYIQSGSSSYAANHPDAIYAYNSSGSMLSSMYNGGVSNPLDAHHAHWVMDDEKEYPVIQMRNGTANYDNSWKAYRYGFGKSYTDLGLTHGDTYTISWDQKTTNLDLTLDIGLYGNNGTSNSFYDGRSNQTVKSTKLDTWQRLYKNFTVASVNSLNHNPTIYGYGFTGYKNGILKIANYQIEKGYGSSYTHDSRNSNECLYDVTGNTTLDVANVSFNSDGQITFDGMDDSLILEDPGVSSSTGFSIELVIKPGNASTSPRVITPLSGGIDHYVRFSGNGTLYLRMILAADSSTQDFKTNSVLSSTDYHHVTFTFKQSEGGKAYYNGTLENSSTANFTALDWTSTWRVGQRGNNTYFYQGELPVLKVYDRALTETEVKQNYNALKGRFNLE